MSEETKPEEATDPAQAEQKETEKAPRPAPEKAAPARTPRAGPRGAPAWVAAVYFGGLAVFYIGQRVVVGWEMLALSASVLGGLALVGATLVRLLPQFRSVGEHARIANLLLVLQLVGIASIALYFASTESGLDLFGFEGESRELAVSLLQVAWTTLVAMSSTALLFAEAALHPMRGAALLESRRVRAAAGSGAVVALVASYGSLFVFAASRTEAQADFSYFKTSEPGEATVKLLQKIADPVKVVAFFPEVSEVRKEVKGYLAQLKQKVPSLEVQFVDRYLQPKLAKEHKVSGDGSLVLSRGESQETLRVGTELDKRVRDKLRTLDQDFHAELLELLRKKRVAYATIGHGELNDKDLGAQREQGRSSEIFFEDLERQNYRVKDLGLSQGLATGIPDDAGIVMVLGPIHPFAPEEVDAIRQYLDRGGKVLLALDTDAMSSGELAGRREAATPGATANPPAPAEQAKPRPTSPNPTQPTALATKPAPAGTAAKSNDATRDEADEQGSPVDRTKSVTGTQHDWRIELAEAVGVEFVPVGVADDQKFLPVRNNASAHAVLFTNRFSSHASVSTLSRHSNEAVVIVNGASHLRPLEGAPGKSDVTLRTLSSAFEDKNQNFERDVDETSEAFNLAVAVTRPRVGTPAPVPQQDEGKDDEKEGKADLGPEEMRAFVIADADVFSDLLMFRFRTNRYLAADAVRWLGGEESLAGEIENEEDVRVEQTKQADMTWFYTSIFGVPFMVLGVGLLLSYRLRRGGEK